MMDPLRVNLRIRYSNLYCKSGISNIKDFVSSIYENQNSIRNDLLIQNVTDFQSLQVTKSQW